MGLINAKDIITLDYAYLGKPFCDTTVGAGLSLNTLDYAHLAKPFNGNYSGIFDALGYIVFGDDITFARYISDTFYDSPGLNDTTILSKVNIDTLPDTFDTQDDCATLVKFLNELTHVIDIDKILTPLFKYFFTLSDILSIQADVDGVIFFPFLLDGELYFFDWIVQGDHAFTVSHVSDDITPIIIYNLGSNVTWIDDSRIAQLFNHDLTDNPNFVQDFIYTILETLVDTTDVGDFVTTLQHILDTLADTCNIQQSIQDKISWAITSVLNFTDSSFTGKIIWGLADKLQLTDTFNTIYQFYENVFIFLQNNLDITGNRWFGHNIDDILQIQSQIEHFGNAIEELKSVIDVADTWVKLLAFQCALNELCNLLEQFYWVQQVSITDEFNANDNVFQQLSFKLEQAEQFILAGEVTLAQQALLVTLQELIQIVPELKLDLQQIYNLLETLIVDDRADTFIVPYFGAGVSVNVPDTTTTVLLYHPTLGMGSASYPYVSYTFNNTHKMLFSAGLGGVYQLTKEKTNDTAGLVLDMAYLSSPTKKFLYDLYVDGEITKPYQVKIQTDMQQTTYTGQYKRLKIGKGLTGTKLKFILQDIDAINELVFTPIESRRSK
jgi:hypothetical protein